MKAAWAVALAAALVAAAPLAAAPRPQPKPPVAAAPGSEPDADAATEALAGPGEPDAAAAEGIGLPAPRPAPPPPGEPEDPAGEAAEPVRADAVPPTRETPAGCLADLAAAGAVFGAHEPIADGSCDIEAPLSVSAVGSIRLENEAILRCDAALALARWTDDVVRPSAETHLGAKVQGLVVAASYVCRGRRTGNGSGGKLSEHALANAIDISAVVLADGRRVQMVPRPNSAAPERAFQAAIRGGACALFTTVLGPGTNAAHADHLHLDRAYRRGGYRLCQ